MKNLKMNRLSRAHRKVEKIGMMKIVVIMIMKKKNLLKNNNKNK